MKYQGIKYQDIEYQDIKHQRIKYQGMQSTDKSSWTFKRAGRQEAQKEKKN